jgi:hypothetical protein
MGDSIRIGLVVVAALAIGCHAPEVGTAGDDGGPVSVPGTVGGSSFAAKDAISTDGSIFISSAGGLCGIVSNNQETANSQDLVISVSDVDANGNTSSPSGPGTYVVNQHPFESPGPYRLAFATYVTRDGNCSVGTHHYVAVYGTVTLTRAVGGSYAGSYDLTFNNPHDLVGTFDAAACSGLATMHQGGGSPTCSH